MVKQKLLGKRKTAMEALFSDEYATKLETLAKEKSQEHKNGKQIPHIYFDDFLLVEIAQVALKDFPEPKRLTWTKFDRPTERKLALNVVEKLPPSVRKVLYSLNSRPMLTFLEILIGLKSVISDPYYAGGGLHSDQAGRPS
jgi:hypothetical protein